MEIHQSARFLGPKICVMVPRNIKNCKALQEFKRLIKVWKLQACPCRIYKKTSQISVSFDKTHLSLNQNKKIGHSSSWIYVSYYSFFNLYIIHNQENESRFMSRYTLYRIN